MIRRLTGDDAEVLWNLRLKALELFPAAFSESPDEHRKTTPRSPSNDGFVLGAFDGPNLVGMTGLHRQQGEKRRHKARIWGVFVLPSHQGRGIARALVSTALEEARALPGLSMIQLSVAVSQQAARSLYLSLGFRSFGIEPKALCVNGECIAEDHMYFPLLG